MGIDKVYRPSTLDEVLGHNLIKNSIQGAFECEKVPHAFLLVGETGSGKTTIARIIANMLGVNRYGRTETDSALLTGIDAMRELIHASRHKSIIKGCDKKFVIIDEAHLVTVAAQNALLKVLEEPPKHLYFALCTTNPEKIIPTVKNRCISYEFKKLETSDIIKILERACEGEGAKRTKAELSLIAQVADGSPRNALTSLEKCFECEDITEIREMLSVPEENGTVYEVCRELVGSRHFGTCAKIIKKMSNSDAEVARIHIVNYLNGCLLKAKKKEIAQRFSELMESFILEFSPATAKAELTLAVSRICN